MNLNKGISTPIAIVVIVVVFTVAGVLVWQLTKTSPEVKTHPPRWERQSTQSTCEEAGYYWYDGTCHEENHPQEEEEQEKGKKRVENCGTTSVSFSSGKPEGGYDPTLECLGNNMLNDCKEAKAVLVRSGRVYNINIKNTEQCIFRLEYGDEDQLMGEEKKYANEYFECPIFEITPRKIARETDASGGEFAYEFMLTVFMTLGEYPEQAKAWGCTGPLLQK